MTAKVLFFQVAIAWRLGTAFSVSLQSYRRGRRTGSRVDSATAPVWAAVRSPSGVRTGSVAEELVRVAAPSTAGRVLLGRRPGSRLRSRVAGSCEAARSASGCLQNSKPLVAYLRGMPVNIMVINCLLRADPSNCFINKPGRIPMLFFHFYLLGSKIGSGYMEQGKLKLNVVLNR